jgi:hypothetical protein
LKFKAVILALSLLGAAGLSAADMSTLPGANNNAFMDRRMKTSSLDRNALRNEVDETHALIDGLARESRNLQPKDLEPLFKSLANEYYLPALVGKARKALEQMEAVLDVQDAIRAQQARLKDAPVEEADREEKKLLGLQSDLMAAVEDLRDTLREIHKKSSPDLNRDFRNWIMVSEGLLRNRREDAEAQALKAPAPETSTPAEAKSLDAGAVSPTASALSPTAGAAAAK